jgi:hypothetical protein
MATSHVQVETRGALFTGQASRDVRKMLDQTKEEIAKAGEQQIRMRLGQVLKNPTGHYQSQIHTKALGRFADQLITDGGVIYGPWLETGKYTPPRRFKGYNTFRRVTGRLRRWWIPVTQRRVDQLIGRWNS